jgi:CDP-diglyceride synthetase
MNPSPGSRLVTMAIVAINAVHQRIVVVQRRPMRMLSALKAYLIGIPLVVAIPAVGVFVGLRLAHNPRFTSGNSTLADPIVGASFFVLTAFFTCVRWFGLLAALGIATFILLSIVLLCAWVIGSLAIAAVRRDRADERVNDSTGDVHASALPLRQASSDEAQVADGQLEAFLRR